MKIKLIVIALSVLSGGTAGVITGIKMAKEPVCNCPEIKMPKQQSALKVNSIDVSELKKLKIRGGFTYSPTFQADQITIVQSDTTKN